MKLYATIKSERAKKGQGGNNYLDIEIFIGNAKKPISLARLTVRPTDALEDYGTEEAGAGYILVDADDNAIAWYSTTQGLKNAEQTKGKKQKGETPEREHPQACECGACTGD